MTDINEGLTNNYLVHGTFLIIGGAPFIYFHLLYWLPFIVVAVALFRSSNGVLIDSKNKQYKRYGNILGYKTGVWKPIEHLLHATLVLKIEKSKTNQTYLLGSRGQSVARTFDISLLNEFGDSELMYEFIKYQHAAKALSALEKGFDIKTTNKVKAQILKNRANPRR